MVEDFDLVRKRPKLFSSHGVIGSRTKGLLARLWDVGGGVPETGWQRTPLLQEEAVGPWRALAAGQADPLCAVGDEPLLPLLSWPVG